MTDDPCRGKELLLSLVPPSLFRPERKVFCHFPSPVVPHRTYHNKRNVQVGVKAVPPPSPPNDGSTCHAGDIAAICGGGALRSAPETGRGQMSAARPLVRQGRAERGRASPIMSFHRCLHRNRRSPERERKKAVFVGRLVQWTSGGRGTDFAAAACCLTSTTPFTCPCLSQSSPVHHTLDKKGHSVR